MRFCTRSSSFFTLFARYLYMEDFFKQAAAFCVFSEFWQKNKNFSDIFKNLLTKHVFYDILLNCIIIACTVGTFAKPTKKPHFLRFLEGFAMSGSNRRAAMNPRAINSEWSD